MSDPTSIVPIVTHIHFPPELPVSQRREDIARAISENQVVIVAGATGSGKTTQLPKICLELGRTSIGHTQPRRIAARTIAERIADELGTELGGIVGYQVRFTDRVSADTRIKLMTDGILLNEIHRDRLLRKYDTIIIDEAHERSLTIDFLLGYLKQLLPQRPDLKLIITSATIDPESFSRHFGGAPIVEVSGRTYPVEIRYRPLVAEAPEDDEDVDGPSTSSGDVNVNRDYLEGINAALDELALEAPGDVLVFLSGESEIRDAEDAIRGRNLSGTEILPLYGRLSAADQHRVFQSPSTGSGTGAGIRRRIVLATNVAETSLTVPGIKYVIDAGTARISRYSTRAKIQRLPIEAISQASANQRSGRSGRTSDGIAIRLYSEGDFLRRPEYTEPEILRTNLAAVILQMISLGLGDIQAFPFLQPPDSRGIKDGLDLLAELGAVAPPESPSSSKGPNAITPIGKQLTQLPVDPRLARMIVESKKHGVTREVLAITAALTIQDVRERPLEKRTQADQLHARFVDPTSDFLTLLNLWNYLKDREKELSGNQFRRLVKSEYLNFLRIREWFDLYRQLTRSAKQVRLTVGEPSVNPDGIHRSLLAGLLRQLGIRDAAKRDYQGARQVRFVLFPGSALAKKQPAAVMSAELVETSRVFARMNAAIDPAWAEPIAGDLVKRSYGEPHWEKRQGAAVAIERATLYGVPIVVNRRVQFARIDPAWARELFIRHALVDGEWDSDRIDKRLTAFDGDNRALREELAGLEERTRRRDILYDDEAIFEFYDARIPKDVATTRTFESWWRAEHKTHPDLLTMTRETLAGETAIDEEAFPASWQQGDQTLPLDYRFEPGSEDDGVTVRVPLALLASLTPAGFDWLVPGLREELVTALLKTLPKAIRRNVVPAADWARRLLAELPTTDPAELEQTTLTEYLAAAIQRLTYTPVEPDDFETERLPAHLRMTFAIIGDKGAEVARSKDLISLQQKLKTRGREAVVKVSASTPHAIERSGITSWNFGELPRVIDTRTGDTTIRAYPAIVDHGDSVSITLMSTAADQALQTPAGVRRLVLLATPSPLSYVREHLTQNEKLLLAASPYQSVQALFDDCMVACVDAGIRRRSADGIVWNRDDFESTKLDVSAGLVDALYETVATVSRILGNARDVDRAIRSATSMALVPALTDAREQLAGLVFAGFISSTGTAQLRHVPRYLAAITSRIEKLPVELARDRTWQATVQASTESYVAAGGRIPLAPSAPDRLVRVRWMLEELRVSLFAQQLGTAETISPQRIVKALAD
ncbi:MAG TPA: ATP-dependent RNA helicase HrpA [Galbitalea sp.]|nr:ATP-dependent RNA helicase HrpA [Galbitalea sp.]